MKSKKWHVTEWGRSKTRILKAFDIGKSLYTVQYIAKRNRESFTYKRGTFRVPSSFSYFIFQCKRIGRKNCASTIAVQSWGLSTSRCTHGNNVRGKQSEEEEREREWAHRAEEKSPRHNELSTLHHWASSFSLASFSALPFPLFLPFPPSVYFSYVLFYSIPYWDSRIHTDTKYLCTWSPFQSSLVLNFRFDYISTVLTTINRGKRKM